MFIPETDTDVTVVTPETLTQQRLVLDAHVTNEHWVLCDITMKLIKRSGFIILANVVSFHLDRLTTPL